MKSYLKFIIKSTNQHGVHSPFVFNLVTKCFYDRKRREWDQQLKEILKNNTIKLNLNHARLLVRLLHYLRSEKVLILENSDNHTDLIFKTNTSVTIDKELQNEKKYDLIYLALNNQELVQILPEVLKKVHNNSILIIPKPHLNRVNERIWQSVTNNPKVIVAVDTYYFGFIFFRKEQVKEYFIIRL